MKKRILLALLLVVLAVFLISNNTNNIKAAGDYEFVSDGNSTVEKTENSTIFTLTSSTSYITLDVSEMNVDRSKVLISLQYQVTGPASGFVTYVNFIDTTDFIYAAGLVAPSTSVGSPWNLKEHVVADNYIISTVDITSYANEPEVFENITLGLNGSKGATFELFDFAITTDGNHGFDLNLGNDNSDTEDLTRPVYTFESASSTTTVVNNVATINGTSGAIKTNTNITDLSSVYFSMKYKSTGVTGIETVAYDGETAEWPAVLMPVNSDRITETVYEEAGFTVVTANITGKVEKLTALTALRFNITCEEGATFEVLDFAITTDGKHGFDLPMVVVKPESTSKYTVTTNDKDELVVSYDIHETSNWYTVDIPVLNYNYINSIVEFTFTPEHDTMICFSVDGERYTDHITYKGGEKHTFIMNLNDNPYFATDEFEIRIYFDAKVSITEPNSVVFNSIEWKSALAEMFNKYYNGGSYVRNTTINFNEEALVEAQKFFHAGVTVLNRTTYFIGEELWMSRGEENSTYSYYGSQNGWLTSGTATEVGVTPEQLVNAIADTSMEDYYTTLFDIKNLDVKWTYKNGIYTSTDEAAIQAFLDFTAPCFLNFTEENANYISLTKVTVQETNAGLVLKLWTTGDEGKLVEGANNLLSQAIVTYAQ